MIKIKLSDNFYIECLKNNPEIIELIKKDVPCLNIYLICLSHHKSNIFEILHSPQALKPRNRDMLVVGAGQGKKEAIDLLLDIISDHLKKWPNIDNIKEVFNKENYD